MGTSTSMDQLTGKLEKLAHELGDPVRPLNVTALEAKRIMSITGAGVVGHRIAGKRKVGVRYTIRGQGHQASAVVGYTGPAHLVNNPTQGHEIDPRRGRGRRSRRRGSSVLRFNAGDGGFAPSVHHPGTTGKHFYEKAKAIITRKAPLTYTRVGLTEPLRRVFH